jgi:hypothetical protein
LTGRSGIPLITGSEAVGHAGRSAVPPSLQSAEAVAESRENVTAPVTVGRISPHSANPELLSQLKGEVGAINMCYPANQLMHQVSEWFVRRPPRKA